MSTVASTCSTSATDRAGAACTRDDAKELWSIAQQLNNCEGYAEYLRVCPTANRAGFAKVMRQKLSCDAGSAPAAASATTPAATPEPPAFPREDDYRSAQTELGRLGFYRGGVDGAWGPGSQSAMRAFQQGAGLSPDGRLTEASLAALKAAPTPAPSAPSSASLASGSAGPCRDCADAMTVVSWGGTYSRSQQKAYAEPYQRLFPSVRITHDQSSAESVARLRAMREAGYVTWDLVDVVAADGIRLCDEGLAAPIDPDRDLAAAPDGSPARSDFGATLISECFIPQIIYST
ncbi:MAG: peptidoglycan-binding protein, partial [Pseudomonadota bacterium]